MATALSNLLALLALDNSAYLEGLAGSQVAADDFGTKLSNVGGAVVLGGLTAAATAVVAIGGAAFDAAEQVDEAFDKIAVGTGATGDQLAILQDDFKAVFASVPTDANTAAEAITILASRLDVSGEALQNIATPMLEVTRILGGDLTANAENFTRVIGDWSIPVGEASGSLDQLFVAAQNTGVPLDQLMERVVQYGAPMRNFNFSRRAFVTQTLEMIVDDFPPNYALKVARPRLQSVTSVTYYDEDNNSAVWTDYVVNARSEPGTIIFDSLPSVALMESGGVVVRFVAGYGAAAAVPERIKNLILSLVAYWYENRESRDVPADIRKGFVAERAVWF